MTYEYIEPTWDGVVRGRDVYNTLSPGDVLVLEFGTCVICNELCTRLTPAPWGHDREQRLRDHEPLMYLITEEPW